ncbi:MAG: ABC transporter substrate-binding protein [Gammaproteobacteria bacterium]|nr:ABC transporter substrate-binding protein [Gammaproteobacteria bacterium]
MRRLLSLAVGLVVLGCAVFAGGQSDTAVSGPAKIVGMLGTGQPYDGFVEQFQKENPNIEVELIPAPNTSVLRRDKYVTMFAAGDGSIDVVLMNTVSTGEYAASLWILPLDDHVQVNDIKNRNYGSFYNACMWKGKLYGIPLTADTLNFYWRSDLLEGSGMSKPDTWADMVTQAEKLQSKDIFGMASSWERGNQIHCQFLLFIAGNGGDVLNKDYSKVIIDSKSNVEALQMMADMINRQKIAPKDVLSLTVDDGRIVFNEGRAVFNINWDYAWGRYQGDDSPVKGKVGVGTAPTFKKPVSVLGGWNLGINKFSKNKEAALAFIKYITTDKMATWMVLNSSQTSPNKVAMSTPEYVERNPMLIKALAKNYDLAVSRPVTSSYAEITEVISQDVMPALFGEDSPEAALGKAAENIRKIME